MNNFFFVLLVGVVVGSLADLSHAALPPVLIPQTGQVTCYDTSGAQISCSNTGQDGDVLAGLAWPYPRFTDNSISTISVIPTLTDNMTGLMWSKDGNAPGPANCATGTTKTWPEAMEYITCLNANSYLGYSDWRLPNRNELESLINMEKSEFSHWLSEQGFLNASYYYWSSTTSANNTNLAWVVYMDRSIVVAHSKYVDFSKYYVWPVRSAQSNNVYLRSLPKTGQTTCYDPSGTQINCAGTGQDGDIQAGISWPNPRFTDNGDQTMTDNLTGINWSKNAKPSTTTLTWEQSLDFIKTLNNQNYLGYSDWRLPNRLELESLQNKGQNVTYTWLNEQGFLNATAGYWSSSNYANNQSGAWSVDLGLGGLGSGLKAGTYYVWPVRTPLQFGSLTISPNSADFIGTNPETLSMPVIFTLVNNGLADVIVSTISIYGFDANQFSIAPGGPSTCPNFPFTLPSSANCSVEVIFSPHSIGVKNATLLLKSDDVVNPILQSRLTGTSIAPLNGVCGSSNKATFSVKPTTELCSFGVASEITGTGPWSWLCTGSNGGITDTCNANVQTWAINSENIINGEVLCESPVNSGTSSTCTITPLAGYSLATFTDNLLDVKSQALGSKYILTNVIANHTVTGTFIDITSPSILAFKIPTTSTSLVVAISTLSATDNSNNVSGYLVSESTAQPQSNDSAWSTTPPTQFVFSSQGVKTLYAFAMDASGNISLPASAPIIITLPSVSGVCGDSNGQESITIPSSNLCNIGSASTVTGNGPWEWTCSGSNGGTSAICISNIQTWTIAASSNVGGSISPQGSVVTSNGSDKEFSVDSTTGYTITDLKVDGESQVLTTIYPLTHIGYAFTNVTGNHTISVTFSQIPPFAINGACGSSNGGLFSIVPASNLCTTGSATSVTGNGPWSWNCASTNGGTTASCNANIQTYTITSNVTGSNGTVSCQSPVNIGAITTCTITPASGYQLGSFTDNSVDKVGSASGGSYTIANATANHTIVATFNQTPLTPVNGACGASNGGTFSIVPTSNLCTTGTTSSVIGTGPWIWSCSGTGGGTTASCSASLTIPQVSQFIVTPTIGSGFTFLPATPQSVTNGGNTTFTVSPVTGYGIAAVTGCNGSLNGTTYTTSPITADCSINVTAVARTASSGGNTLPPTITDALKVLQAVVGITPLTATEQIRYDVAPLATNGTPVGNGSIDSADVILILRRSIGIGSW